jgi:hypothetical protein
MSPRFRSTISTSPASTDRGRLIATRPGPGSRVSIASVVGSSDPQAAAAQLAASTATTVMALRGISFTPS